MKKQEPVIISSEVIAAMKKLCSIPISRSFTE